MKPSIALQLHQIAVREAASHFREANPRVFGSVVMAQTKEVATLTYWSMRYRALLCSILAACKWSLKNCSACRWIC